MRILPVIAATGMLVGVAAWFLLPRSIDAPSGDPDAPAAAPTMSAARPIESAQRAPTTGRLVVRVKTSDGSPVPDGTKAGYVHLGVPRMRRPAADGTFPFPDAPVEKVEAVADAPGYTSERVPVVVVGNLESETVVLISPVK